MKCRIKLFIYNCLECFYFDSIDCLDNYIIHLQTLYIENYMLLNKYIEKFMLLKILAMSFLKYRYSLL
jgi:hypothetical protein